MSVLNRLLFGTIIGAGLGIVGLVFAWCAAVNHTRKSFDGGEDKISLGAEKNCTSDIPDPTASPVNETLRFAGKRHYEERKHGDNGNHPWHISGGLLDGKAVNLADSPVSEGPRRQGPNVCLKSLPDEKKTSHDLLNHPVTRSEGGDRDGQILDKPGQDIFPYVVFTGGFKNTASGIFPAMEVVSSDHLAPINVSSKEKEVFRKTLIKLHGSHTDSKVGTRAESGRAIVKPKVQTSYGFKNNFHTLDIFTIENISNESAKAFSHVHEAKGDGPIFKASPYKGSYPSGCEMQTSGFQIDKSPRWFRNAAQGANTTIGEFVKGTNKEPTAKTDVQSVTMPQVTKVPVDTMHENTLGEEFSLQSTDTTEPSNYVRSSLFCDCPEFKSSTVFRDLQVKQTSLKSKESDPAKTGSGRDRGSPRIYPSARHVRPVPVAFPVPRTLDFTPGLLFRNPRPFEPAINTQITHLPPEISKSGKDIGIFTRVAPWVGQMRGPMNEDIMASGKKHPVVQQLLNSTDSATFKPLLEDPVIKKGDPLIFNSRRVFAPREQKHWFSKAKKGLDFTPDHLFRNPRPFPQVPGSQLPLAKTLDESLTKRKRVIQNGSLENPMVGRVKLVSKMPERDPGFTYKTWTNVGEKRNRDLHQCQRKGGCRVCE